MVSNTREIGFLHEKQAVNYLLEHNYKILETNYRVGRGNEIDIIAAKNETICFIEVKFRNSSVSGHPFESVNYSKQKKICKAARKYICDKKIPLDNPFRFDVIGIIDGRIEHLENAFYYIEG